jgi:hypothetical protein
VKSQFSIYPPGTGDFKVTTPFDFVVEKQAVSPGNYIVHREKASDKLQICEDGVLCETVETAAIKAPGIPVRPKVMFSRYGTKFFLRDKSGSRMALDSSHLPALGNQKWAGQE